jgi:hypothetical protein
MTKNECGRRRVKFPTRTFVTAGPDGSALAKDRGAAQPIAALLKNERGITDDGSVPGKATIEKAKTYRIERGQAGIFQDRAIHSIAYPAGARFIRVTGTNLENIARGRYNIEAGTMVVEKRPNFRGAA